ncbi:MAG: prolipoprotein diacylglyceryl transferase [Nitrosomonadales bacterium]|jgi:phosphatidylglycerol:prolipoprotein diacylglycerol transferase|nr:prolipoprotein diacylglyceryl transferase [Nitrosomonadales bacterium]MBT3918597.1 prolipoprotein diacylglyceryl transferase [Nitrosomonadales bacterium]MBT4183401.1 prolipoprotein diacylglyceryl transferase [Nitrosomonadales bacterium]MBT4571548.1 prolipoprotein diacylglyceryl transferase [Nitrosomonadales bacterium]MBT5149890.1 prolipoprotein diacylglyceryl transferase [Nitrosomonadales bacterium]
MLTHPQFDPIAISLGPIELHWYGLMYFIGFLSFIYFGKKQLRNQTWSLIDEKMLDDMFFFGALGVILGGRLGYVFFYQPGYYLNHPAEIFAFWQGGMSFHGGFLGVLIGMMMIARKYQIRWLVLTDFIAPLVPLGLGFGRIGNFINQELWGRPTEASWGIIFPAVDNVIRHPSQIYQSFFEGLVLFLILWFYAKKKRDVGKISALFLIFYGLFRFLIEYTREPDGHLGLLYLDFSMGQWLSFPMLILGIFMYFKSSTINNND